MPRIQERLTEAVRSWDDRMVDAVIAERADPGSPIDAVGSESAVEQGQRFAAVFPESYKEDFTAAEALADLRRIAVAAPATATSTCASTCRRDAAAGGAAVQALPGAARASRSRTCSRCCRHMGVEVVDERPYELRHDGRPRRWWIYDFGLRDRAVDAGRVAPRGARHPAHPVPGGVRRRVARRRGGRPVQRARGARRASAGGRPRCCAPTRVTCARPARPTARTTSRTRCSATPRSPPRWCGCSRSASTRACPSRAG